MYCRIIDNFLTPEECTKLIELARPKLEVATSWDTLNAKRQITDYRMSDQMFFQLGENDLVKKIETKISNIIGLPVENGEGIQILRYGVGGHYKEHADYFDPAFEGNQIPLKQGGQRLYTVIIYLNDVQKGGWTFFPRTRDMIAPKQGRALLFRNVDEQRNPDPDTIHEGQDVSEGEKWLLSKWIRERTFTYEPQD